MLIVHKDAYHLHFLLDYTSCTIATADATATNSSSSSSVVVVVGGGVSVARTLGDDDSM